MPRNLLTGNANRGNLPSCSCVLRETLETGETAVPWLFPPWLWWQNSSLEGGDKLDNAQIICHTIVSHSHSLKGTDKTRSTVIGRGLWKSILLLTCGAPPKRFHIPASTHDFWPKKKNNFNFRMVWTIDFTAPILLFSFCPLSSALPLTYYSFLTPTKRKHGHPLLGQRGTEWHLYVNFIILGHSTLIQVASGGLVLSRRSVSNFSYGGSCSNVFRLNCLIPANWFIL